MAPDYVTRWIFGALFVIVVVGLVDSLVDEQYDAAALFAMATTGLVVLATRVVLLRPVVRIRPDHLGWLRERAVDGEETVAAVVDRGIGAYRAGLTGDENVGSSR
jgi:hypothetical protein